MTFLNTAVSRVCSSLKHLCQFEESKESVYQGTSKISFLTTPSHGLSVSIDTKRLHIRSVKSTEAEYIRYAKLFGDADVMRKYATGQTKSKEDMQKRIQKSWVPRWESKDPYSGLAVFKKEDGEFLGHIVLGHGDHPGESEVAYIFHKQFWGQGYGGEAVSALIQEYAPATIREGYLLDGKPLERIVTTVRPDNPASIRIAQKVGMIFVVSEEKYGAERHHYIIDLPQSGERTLEKTEFTTLSFLGKQAARVSNLFQSCFNFLQEQRKKFQ